MQVSRGSLVDREEWSPRHRGKRPVLISEELLLSRFGRTSIDLAVAAGLVTLVYSRFIEPRTLRVRQFRAGIPGLPDALDGLRIAFLSDFHVGGPGYGDALARQAVDLLLQEQPDLVLLGGDYVDKGLWHDESSTFDGFKQFPNVIGVLGNHDYRGGEQVGETICSGMARRGVVILRNQSVSVRVRDSNVTIVGVDDPYTRRDDFPAALHGTCWPLVLLTHAPVIEDDLTPGMAGLILCGHTHGGQIRLSPSRKLTCLDYTFYLDHLISRPVSTYQRGFHWANGNLLYVSNGIGTTRWPLRFMAPPEITIFHLSKDAPHPNLPCDTAGRYVEDIG